MLCNVTFKNEEVQQLTAKISELLRELDALTLKLHSALTLEVESPTSGN